LESTVTEFGSSIDIFKFDFLVQSSLGSWQQSFSQNKSSLFGTDTASFKHQVVVTDDTVVWETTHWGNVLLGKIVISRSIVLDSVSHTLTNSIDFFVFFSSVVISRLTSSWDSVLDFGWMPGPDTTDFSQTSMGLSWELSDTPSLGDTGETFTLGNTNNIKNFTILENLVDFQFFLEVSFNKIDFVSSGAAVNLDFHQVSFFGSQIFLEMDLGVAKGSDGGAEFFDSVFVVGLVVFLGNVFGESLLLRSVPVFVHSSLELVGKFRSPNGGESSEPFDGFNVTDETDNFEWWGFDDGHGLDDFFLVESGIDSVDISGDVSHTGLETSESSEVWFLGWVIFWESSDLSSMLSGSLSWQES